VYLTAARYLCLLAVARKVFILDIGTEIVYIGQLHERCVYCTVTRNVRIFNS